MHSGTPSSAPQFLTYCLGWGGDRGKETRTRKMWSLLAGHSLWRVTSGCLRAFPLWRRWHCSAKTCWNSAENTSAASGVSQQSSSPPRAQATEPELRAGTAFQGLKQEPSGTKGGGVWARPRPRRPPPDNGPSADRMLVFCQARSAVCAVDNCCAVCLLYGL